MTVYNRYVPNDHGHYTRIPEEPTASAPPSQSPPQSNQPPPPTPPRNKHLPTGDGINELLRSTLDKFHLQDIDTGDLILLGLLWFLFREDADEELLFALGLLLIL
ncbi:hypothetical protein RFF05_15285 [Bengtsoniella intestinalis]|uniref:hypothetical protein n=1 Tax=Bengtsoniella intestinalis TaxID=3073143 RepID=UPI00391F716D